MLWGWRGQHDLAGEPSKSRYGEKDRHRLRKREDSGNKSWENLPTTDVGDQNVCEGRNRIK